MGWPVLGYLLGKNFRRGDRDHLVPPRRMDAAVCRAEVCHPFGREHGRHRAVRRREFITLLGGATATWPLAARAQQGERLPRIAVRTGMVETDAAFRDRMAAFRHELQQLGWMDGRNVRIDVRAGGSSNPERIRKDVAELLALAPDVIVTAGSPTVGVMQQATRTVPI